jgi:Tfp pilus assembly protein PilF
VDQATATKCLKIATKTGMSFADVYRDQIGQRTDSSTNKLGELLLDAHLIDREQFGKAMQRSLATGLPLGRILVLNGAISEHILTEALEIQVRIRDGMMERMEAVTALRAQIGDFDSEELQRQTMPFKAALTEAPRRKGVRLGELLVMAGLMAETDVMSALEIGLLQEQLIGQVFIAQGFVTEELLEVALALQQKVDQSILQPLEAGQALAKISATGITVDEAIDGFVAPKEQVYEPLTFDKMLVLARVISSEDIESALEQVLQSPQLLAQMLRMTNFIDEHTSSAVLQCYSMMSNNFLSQDDAIIALDYCLNKEVDRQITFGEALSELGWSATQSLQIHAKNSVDITHIRLQAMLAPDAQVASDEAPGAEEATMSMEDYALAEEAAAGEARSEFESSELQVPNESSFQGDDFAFGRQDEPDMVAVEETQQPDEFVDETLREVESYNEPVSEPSVEEDVVTVVDEVIEIADEGDEFVVHQAEDADDEIAQRVAAASLAAQAVDEPIPTVDEEDTAFRQEFDLDASDIARQTEIAAPAEPEPLATKTPSTTPSGLMGSLSSLLSSQSAPPEPAPAQKEGAGALGQMFSSQDAAAAGESGNDALRDLFSPDRGDEAAPAAAAVAGGPANGKSGEHHEAVAVPAAAQVAEGAEAPKGLGGLMRGAPAAAGASTVQARATDAGSDPSEPSAASGAGAGASSLSSMLNKASGAHSVANKFVGLGRVSGSAPPAGSSSSALGGAAAPPPPPAPASPSPASPPVPEDRPAALPSESVGEKAAGKNGDGGDVSVSEAVTDFTDHEFKITDHGETIASADHNDESEPVEPAKPSSAFAGLIASAPKSEEAAPTASPTPAAAAEEASAARAQGSLLSRMKPAAPVPVAPAAASHAGGTTAPPAVAASATSEPSPVLPKAPSTPADSAVEVPAAAAPTAVPAPASPAVSTAELPPVATPVAATPAPIPPAAAVEKPATVEERSPEPAATPASPAPAPKVAEAAAAPAAHAAPPPVAAPAPAAAPAQAAATAELAEAKPEVKEALGSALNRLAESYYQQGNYAEAQGLYEKILSVKQQQLGPKHPALGGDLTNLAGVLCVQGKFAQAEPFVRKVVQLVEAQEPLDVLKLAGSINTLAGILFQQGKLQECEPLLGRALQLRREFLGEEHIEVADSLRDYAKLLKKLGRIEDAEKHYLQAKAIVAKRQQVEG